MEGKERPPLPGREDGVACGWQPPLDDMREGESRAARAAPARDDDPVWTWNAPAYVTGDSYGVAKGDPLQGALENLPGPALTPAELRFQPERGGFDFSVEEKRERAIAHFSVLADLEELKSGPTHFRVILSLGPEVSNREMKMLVNAFLGDNFPESPALVAIHRDTGHTHAHLYVHLRQLDGKRVGLGQRYFRLDENWMKICSEHLGDKEILDRHLELKAETLAWKEQAAKARGEGQPLPPKPDRRSDHKDTELSFRPWNDQWCGRLQAQTRVAETKLQYLAATGAREEEIAAAREEAEKLRGRLDAARQRRSESRSEAKSRMPAEIVTISEARELLGYEREIQRSRTEKVARPERQTTARPAGQRVLQFEQPRAARVTQLGLGFDAPPETRLTHQVERKAAVSDPQGSARGRDRAAEARIVEITSPSVEEAARSFGRELVAEARLAFTERRAGESRSRKEQREVKGRLTDAAGDYAAAREGAERHRSSLHERGVGEPPYRLEEDEKKYLGFVPKYVSERLRERIETEVARSQAVPKTEDEPVRREAGGPEVVVKTLPDDEVSQLVVRLELAKVRAAALRVEEADFRAAPQYWVSPAQQVTLAQTEAQIDDSLNQGKSVKELNAIKERLQSEIAVERARLPSRRREAEKEARSLEERLSRESDDRGALNVLMPVGNYTPEALRELTECAERARDPQLLRRVFEIERGQAVRDATLTGDAEHVRRLEEKYTAIELKAEVSAHRRETTFVEVAERPERIRLPSKDLAGRDTAVTLEQLGVRTGGLTGLVKRAFETGARRHSREQFEAARGECLRHLRADSERGSAFREAARQIARECREKGRELGYARAAVPALSRDEIKVIRDYAVKQLGGPRDRWLMTCVDSQRQSDDRALTAAGQQPKGREVLPTGMTEAQRAGLIRDEIASRRDDLSAAFIRRLGRPVVGRDGPDDRKPRELDKPRTNRGGGSRGGR